MLQAATFKFLKDLKKNNNKPWFENHKSEYQAAKEDFEEFVQQVIDQFGKTDPAIAPLQSKDCTFRIYRDVRFSKDKTPYKTNMSAFFNKGGKKLPTAGYYIHCEPGRCMIGGGLWMPMPPELNKVRQEIDYHLPEWKKIVDKASFRKVFPKGVEGVELLSRPPKGYDETHPAIEYLKMKCFIVEKDVPDAGFQSKSALKEVVKTFGAMKDFVAFLNRGLE
jgi:uncharacterized protein (TIGR02453 family)